MITQHGDFAAKIRQTVLAIPMETMVTDISKNFVFQEEVLRTLYIGVSTNKNVLLYGPPGFGKSSIVKAFCDYFSVPLNVVVGYEDMDAERLIGPPDIKKFTEESKYVTKFEHSAFSNYGILNLEEFLDVRPSTAATLKDILTENGMRIDGEKYESKIGSCIICTNKDPQEFENDASIAALYLERFPIRTIVQWTSYSSMSYTKYFRVKYTDKYDEFEADFLLLAELCSKSEGVSPRIAKDAADVMLSNGIESVKYITGIDTTDLENIVKHCKVVNSIVAQKEVLKNVLMYLSDLILRIEGGSITPSQADAAIELVNIKLNEISLYDETTVIYDSITELMEEVQELTSTTLIKSIQQTIKTEINDLF